MWHPDATFLTYLLQTLIHILFANISPKYFDFIPTLILNQIFPNLECLKDFRFEFEKVNLENLEKSYMKVNTDLDPPYEGVGRGTIRYE